MLTFACDFGLCWAWSNLVVNCWVIAIRYDVCLCVCVRDRRKREKKCVCEWKWWKIWYSVISVFMQEVTILHNWCKMSTGDTVCKCVSLGREWCVQHWTHDQKVASSNPDRSSGRIFLARVNFVCWQFSAGSSPLLPPSHVKDPGHAAKSAGSRLPPRHTFTLDPTKSEWVDYAAV